MLLYSFFFAGFLGGVVRGIVGLIKHVQSYKEVPIKPWYFSGMVVLSGLIGLLSAWIVQELGITFLGVETLSPAIAVIVGYAGGDFIENIFKIIIKQPNL
ncbi:MAG: hypothetical protein FJZ07_00035 [Candidatus Nealsonbacteria bacterium]|nr:hypothetical protein [Candidatus Nealsonbacteria bacterium]